MPSDFTSAIKHVQEQITLFHMHRYELPLTQCKSSCTNSTTESCTGSCEWETKQKARQRMAPVYTELSSKRTKQPPCTTEFLLGERWRAYMLSKFALLLKLSSACVNWQFGDGNQWKHWPSCDWSLSTWSHPHGPPCTLIDSYCYRKPEEEEFMG